MRWIVVAFALVGCATQTATPGTPEAAPPVAEAEGAPEAAPSAGKREDTDIAGLVAARERGATVIDVRTPEEYAAGHVPGAIPVPLVDLTGHPALASIPKDGPVYVICRSGARSSRAADQLAAAGWHAVNVEGGTLAWQAAGHPVE